MNKKAQWGGVLELIFMFFVTVVLWFLLLSPIVSPMIDAAVAASTTVEVKLLFKVIPFAFLFGLVLFLVQLFKR